MLNIYFGPGTPIYSKWTRTCPEKMFLSAALQNDTPTSCEAVIFLNNLVAMMNEASSRLTRISESINGHLPLSFFHILLVEACDGKVEGIPLSATYAWMIR